MPAADRPAPDRARPNVVLIMADDMGFSDIGCFGSEIATPNLDRLAAGGMRLTQLYNNARCCPTRASLLTGLAPHQAGIGHMVADQGAPGYRGFLSDGCVTLAETLRDAGYRTAMSGKWHVGGDYGIRPGEGVPGDPGHPLPVQRGFERHYGTLTGAGSYFNPHTLVRDDTPVQPDGDGYYYTDAITDDAVDAIDAYAAGPDPFFLYVAHVAPHWPLHAFPDDVERYRGRYRHGWDRLRAERHERLRDAGLVDPDWPISARDEDAPPWEQVRLRDWEDARMATYAAQIERMDRGVGRIMQRLRERDLEQDTLVLFLSDNGGCAELLREEGYSRAIIDHTRDGRPVRRGNVPGLLPGGEDTYASYGLPWANASNTPFRLFKHWVHEGGIATPFVAHWPAAIPAGGVSHQPAHIVDLAATCLDVCGAEHPQERGGRPVPPLEGISLAPLLRGRVWRRGHPIVWEHEGNRAVRDGQWKLVSRYPGDWELYDMARNRTETDDLAGGLPDRVAELAGVYDRWAQRCAVLPWDQVRALPVR